MSINAKKNTSIRSFRAAFFLFILIQACAALTASSGSADADELADAMALWRKHALWCEGWGGERFPTMRLYSSDPEPEDPTCRTVVRCQDGDATMLPNALLCAAGEEAGCDAVRRAMDADGRWHRSPRYAAHPECKTHDDFSPDMALGAQLYLVTRHDEASAKAWWKHLDKLSKPLNIEACPELRDELREGIGRIENPLERAAWDNLIKLAIAGLASVEWPSFCTREQLKCGCFVRPGDAATLLQTERELHQGLPDGSRLRGLMGTFGGLTGVFTRVGAERNDPGFSRHLVAVNVMLLRRMDYPAKEFEADLDAAAQSLARDEPENPFYRWLAEGPTSAVRELTLKHCPTDEHDIERHMRGEPFTSGPNESAWWRSCEGYPDTALDEHGEPGPHDYFLQRDMRKIIQGDKEKQKRPWCETGLWECVVMGRLLGAG